MTERRRPANQRGVALLVVVLTLAMVTPTVFDFQYNSMVDYKLSINGRDALQAEANALAALRLRALLLRQAKKIEQSLSGLSGALGVDAAAFPVGALIERLPIECGLLSMVLAEAEPAIDAEDAEGSFFPGDCLATAESEHSKIPVNMAGQQRAEIRQKIAARLYGLLSSQAMLRHFEEDDANGQHADSAEDLVAAVIDWVDGDDDQAFSGAGDEERPYRSLDVPYRPKNAPFDSVEELRMVHGVDDELYDVLAGQISIYADNAQIVLSSASESQIFAGLAASVYDGMSPEALLENRGAFVDFASRLSQARALSFGALQVDLLAALVDQAGMSAVVDGQKLRQNFSDKGSSVWYRITAVGSHGNVSKKLNAVFHAREGRFYYYRSE